MSIETIICDLDPAPLSEVPGPDSHEAQAVLQRILGEQPTRRHPRLLTSRVTVGALSVVGAAALVVAFLPGSPTRPTSAAAATLERLAAVAADQPATTPPGPGQYQFTESDESYPDCTYGTYDYCYVQPEQREIWIGNDGSGRLLEIFGAPTFVSAADQQAWVDAGSPVISTATSDTAFGPGGLSDGPSDLSSLPTDPTALGNRLRGREIEGGPPGAGEDFVQIGDLLRETDASPALRSALYQVASTIPGVIALGTVKDHEGRSGVGLGFVGSGGVENEYVLDPTTSALMAEQTVANRAGVGTSDHPTGALLSWAVYLSSGVVSSLSTTPTGSAPPAPPVSCTSAPDSNTSPAKAPGASTQTAAGAASC